MSNDTSPGLGAPVTQAATVRRRRFRLTPWSRLDIQSKLLVMLLVASILSTLVAGYAGYRSGSQSLRSAAYEKLAATRVSKAREITNYLAQLRTEVVLNSSNGTAVSAMSDFTSGFDKLQKDRLDATRTAGLTSYYQKTFLRNLAKNSDGEPDLANYFPTSNASRYLQSYYTAPFTDFEKSLAVNDAGDGSDWSKANGRYQDYFRTFVERNQFEDAMLVTPGGDVVYTAYKGVDLGTNILKGPFASAALSSSFASVLRSNAVGSAAITDFAPYQPSYDAPTAFALSPIGRDGKLIGVLMVQLPTAAINDIMTNGGSSAKSAATADKAWRGSGFGRTGETFLVGPDMTMRSTSRELIENPKGYERDVIDNGTPRSTADKVVANGTTIGLQPLRGSTIAAALRGKSGTTVKTSYLGKKVLNSYQPLRTADVNWAVIAQIDESEALAPVRDLLRNLALATLALILLVSVGSLLAAQAFVRPVRALVSGVRAVASGDLDARVQLTSGDEFGDLGSAFNDMASNLQTKQELLDEQLAENDRLLLTMMPEDVAKRYRGGDQAIAEDHQNVSVVFATVAGFDEFSRTMSSQESVGLLNEIAEGFASAAQRLGVEKVRILRSGYIASCGLVVPRVDHALRTVDFAVEMIGLIDRFNAQHGAELSLRAGIDAGTVTSGLVGGNAVYDMWGESVNLAYSVQSLSDTPGVYVTDGVYEQLRDVYEFSEVGRVTSTGGERIVWEYQGGNRNA